MNLQYQTPLHELDYHPLPSQKPPMNHDGKISRIIIDLLFAGSLIALASCAWTKAHQPQITAVSEVALEHIARDAYNIGLAAFTNEMSSNFSTDMGYALQKSARDRLPYILSSENLSDYLEAWKTAETDSLATLVPKGLDAASAQKVALVIADSQAAAIPAAQL